MANKWKEWRGKTSTENGYLNNLSRGGLFVPSFGLRKYVSKCFAIIDVCHDIIIHSPLSERAAAELSLDRNDLPNPFLCSKHSTQIWLFNRIVANVYFNNERKRLSGTKRKDEVRAFKQRQVKKRKLDFWKYDLINQPVTITLGCVCMDE